MDRPPTNHDVRVMFAAINITDVLKLREVAAQAGLARLVHAADNELRRRSEPEIEDRLKPYRATLRRIT